VKTTIAAAGAVVLLLAGCGTSAPATQFRTHPHPSAPSSNVAPPAPRQELLGVGDLPTGWAVDHAADQAAETLPPCFLASVRGSTATAAATATFAMSGRVPFLRETILSYSPGGARAAYRAAIHRLDGCTDLAYKIAKHPATGSMGVTSFPPLGDESRAYTAAVTVGGTPFLLYLLVVRLGRQIVGLAYGAGAGTNLTTFVQLSGLAFSKIVAS
jgi:hypothetical protein